MKPSIDGHLRTANQVSERVLNWLTLGSLAVVAQFERHPSGSRSSRLNQTRIHRRRQVVLTNHATDLDLLDRPEAFRPQSTTAARFPRGLLRLQAEMTNQLPAYSAGKFQPQPSRLEREHNFRPNAGRRAPLLHRQRLRPAGLCEIAPAWQSLGPRSQHQVRSEKEYQCQES